MKTIFLIFALLSASLCFAGSADPIEDYKLLKNEFDHSAPPANGSLVGIWDGRECAYERMVDDGGTLSAVYRSYRQSFDSPKDDVDIDWKRWLTNSILGHWR